MTARILVIEDNAANMQLMTYLIGAFGHQVETAADGESGIEAALDAPPDLLICDLELPGISGFEVMKHLRQQSQTKGIPMIAVTAYAMVGDRDRILAAGFDGYISKPIYPETFVKEVEAFLPMEKHSSGPPQPEHPAPLTERIRPTSNALVLVVDDAPVNLNLIKSTLEPQGYRVITAETVTAAVKLTHHYAFDLILSDLHMSPDSGLEFLRAIKTNPKTQSIPFLLCSSSRSDPADGIEEQAKALGALRIVSRPVPPERLLEEVASCIASRGEESAE